MLLHISEFTIGGGIGFLERLIKRRMETCFSREGMENEWRGS